MINTTALILQNAINGAIVVDQQLNVLLDGFDFYLARYGDVPGEELLIDDAMVSITELTKLPLDMAVQLTSWRQNQNPQLSKHGFELYVLNEFVLHLFAIYSLLDRKGIELEHLNLENLNIAFVDLRYCNRHIKANP